MDKIEYKVIMQRDIPSYDALNPSPVQTQSEQWYNELGKYGWILCAWTKNAVIFYRRV